ncbi:DUF4123 domain-containing protein [Paraburkholderia sp. CNPSo 3076]|uniref:DUF4123 domain-containing protein n=1 Tax=Paraburkholderia sp. CNPSo 3076 TaxID=2940936 RepID=UPI0022585CE6|nr:DUF4123 domain-containing protein [Paraburkholderia sp. CNPSo 3076]MCX5541287.1 DUF4123 domain-containing protein [Paraburkholderia sp. CNPSo 3076]
MNTYVIAEPSNGELEFGDAPNAYRVGELVPQAKPDLEGVAPVLMRLEHAERQFSRVIEVAEIAHGSGRPPMVCAIIESDIRTDRLHEHLANALLITRPGGSHAVFRYYDPRVFGHLQWILDSVQLQSLLGPVSRWRWLDEGGHWQEVLSSGYRQIDLTFSDEQFKQLERLSLVRKALETVAAAGMQATPEVARQLDRMLLKAERYGLPLEDQIPFALHGMLVAPNFDQHPQVQAILAMVNETPYTEAVVNWTDEMWLRVGKESARYPYQ